MKTTRIGFRVAFFLAILGVLAAVPSARADWKTLAGTYVGPWKSTDTDGKSYSGKATVKIVSGPGNRVTLTVKTALLGNPIAGSAKSQSSGKAAFAVSNPILGTVSGTGKAIGSGKMGTLSGSGVLYVVGTASLAATVKGTKSGVVVSGTVIRAFPFLTSTLRFSFAGKKK